MSGNCLHWPFWPLAAVLNPRLRMSVLATATGFAFGVISTAHAGAALRPPASEVATLATPVPVLARPATPYEQWVIAQLRLEAVSWRDLVALGDDAVAHGDLTSSVLSGMQLYRLASLIAPNESLPKARLERFLPQAFDQVKADDEAGKRPQALQGLEVLRQIASPLDPRMLSLQAQLAPSEHGGNQGIVGLPKTASPKVNAVELQTAWAAAMTRHQQLAVTEKDSAGDAMDHASPGVGEGGNGSSGGQLLHPHGSKQPPPVGSVTAAAGDTNDGSAAPVAHAVAHHAKAHSHNDDEYVATAAPSPVQPESTPPPPPPPPPVAASSTAQPAADPLAQATQAIKDEVPANAVYNTPAQMNFKDTKKIELFMSVGHGADELKGQITGSGAIQTARFGVTDRVQAELKGDAFTIVAVTPDVQLVGSQNVVHWIWMITPKIYGKGRQLDLVVSNIVRDAGTDVTSTIVAYDRTIDVDVTVLQRIAYFEAQNWQWEASTIVIPLAIFGWKSRRKNAGKASPPASGKSRPGSKKKA